MFKGKSNSTSKRSVCIIGAGAAGICALRHFTDHVDHFNPIVCYEQIDNVGGTWNYTEQTGIDKYGLPIHSSMYRDLQSVFDTLLINPLLINSFYFYSTNLPMQVMAYPDFSWEHTQSFVHHSLVLKYLEDYAKHFNILPYISFSTRLEKLQRYNNQWKVVIKRLEDSQFETHYYDIVIIGTGRHSFPHYPPLESISKFNGNIIHSHDYRHRESFHGKRIAVIGGGPSGFDLVIELSTVASFIIFVNRGPNQFENLPINIEQLQGEIVDEFDENLIRIQMKQSGELKQFLIDCIIFATGYQFDFNCYEDIGLHLNTDDTIDGLYRHMINIQQPTMLMLGVCQRGVLPFPLYHQQILCFLKLMIGEIPMPSIEEMEQDVKEYDQLRKSLDIRDVDRHSLKPGIFHHYIDSLECFGQLKPLSKGVLKLHLDLNQIRIKNLIGYKKMTFKVTDDDYQLVSENEDCDLM